MRNAGVLERGEVSEGGVDISCRAGAEAIFIYLTHRPVSLPVYRTTAGLSILPRWQKTCMA
jgi:hypothetical protein